MKNLYRLLDTEMYLNYPQVNYQTPPLYLKVLPKQRGWNAPEMYLRERNYQPYAAAQNSTPDIPKASKIAVKGGVQHWREEGTKIYTVTFS